MFFKKSFLLIIIIFASIFILTACSSSDNSAENSNFSNVKGRITTSEFNSPIEGAVVAIGDKSDITDVEGNYIIKELKNDNYIWSVKSPDYQDFSMDIRIGEDLIIDKSLNIKSGTASISGELSLFNKTSSEVLADSFKIESYSATADLNSIGSKKYIENEIIVKYRDNLSAQLKNNVENKKSLQQLSSLSTRRSKIYKYKLSADKDLASVIDYYNKLPEVEWAEPNYLVYKTAVPSDTRYSEQWGNVNINLEAAWDKRTESRSITAAVIDTGIIPDHPDLKDNLLQGADFVGGNQIDSPENYNMTDNDPTDETTKSNYGSHGTHVSGIIGAVGNNRLGTAGVNWKVNLLPVRVLGSTGYGENWDVAEGIYYAVDRGADVINLSLGAPSASSLVHAAVKYADNAGVIVVAAAGNGGSDQIGDGEMIYPARYEETIAVGALGVDNRPADYSNYGPDLDISAPGGNYRGIQEELILSTWGYYDNGRTYSGYTYMQGTSMAAPYVSGAAALLLADGVSPSKVKARLTSTAVDLGDLGKDDYYGHGLLDVYGALLNKKLENPYVFAASVEGDNLYLKSELIRADADGSFQLNQVLAEDVFVYGWRDVNENGSIDAGDYFGRYDNLITAVDNSSYSADFEIYYLSDSSDTRLTVNGIAEIENIR